MKDRLRILNIEDNAVDAELNRAMLSTRWDCDLVRVDDRQSFRTALEQGGFDVILSDYTMPGFNGIEALTLARQMQPETPFLFVSGTIGEDTAIEALKNGASDYVLKHRLRRLIPAVDRALRETRERSEYQRAEEAMRQSEHKYRELFECLSDAAFLADEKTEKIIDVNRRAETLIRRSRAEILGSKQSRFLALNVCQPPPEPGQSESDSACFDCEVIRPDGSTRKVRVHATRLTLYGRRLIFRLCHEL